jgi:hypothetical protein
MVTVINEIRIDCRLPVPYFCGGPLEKPGTRAVIPVGPEIQRAAIERMLKLNV